jgi:hypothetical protein
MRPSVTAVVIGFNHASYLDRCLGRLRAQTGLERLDVLYIDNASRDRSVEIAATHETVVVMRNERNVGYARAANQGLAAARSPYVALVNPDAALPPTALRDLVEVLGGRPEVGLVAPQLVGEDGRAQVSLAPYPSLRGLVAKHLGLVDDGERWIVGAVVVAETELLRAIGGLEEAYFVYGEDMDLCFRLQQRGRAVHVAAEVRVTHAGNPRWSADRLVRVYGGYLRFAALHRPEERTRLGLALSLLWLARGAGAGQGPHALLAGLRRMWSTRVDAPPDPA